eukprot:6180391-Pleurochrysis_carterae.AAC.2
MQARAAVARFFLLGRNLSLLPSERVRALAQSLASTKHRASTSRPRARSCVLSSQQLPSALGLSRRSSSITTNLSQQPSSEPSSRQQSFRKQASRGSNATSANATRDPAACPVTDLPLRAAKPKQVVSAASAACTQGTGERCNRAGVLTGARGCAQAGGHTTSGGAFRKRESLRQDVNDEGGLHISRETRIPQVESSCRRQRPVLHRYGQEPRI